MPPQAKIWTAKATPRMATLNVRGTTAGKVSLPAIVSDGPGKGRQVNCEIPPNELDAVLATVLKAIESRDAEAAWRESRAVPAQTQRKLPSISQAVEYDCRCNCGQTTTRVARYVKGHKQNPVAPQSGIDVLKEMLTLEPVKTNGHGGARRMHNPPNPEKKMMKCLCGCGLQHFNINGFVYGHKMDKRAKASR